MAAAAKAAADAAEAAQHCQRAMARRSPRGPPTAPGAQPVCAGAGLPAGPKTRALAAQMQKGGRSVTCTPVLCPTVADAAAFGQPGGRCL